jgi:hypothetical protein
LRGDFASSVTWVTPVRRELHVSLQIVELVPLGEQTTKIVRRLAIRPAPGPKPAGRKPTQLGALSKARVGLGAVTTVDYRVLSKPGNPKRDFYVTDKAVVVSTIWKSGTSREYTASKEGLLLNVMDRNTAPGRAAGGFESEMYWWFATISAEKRHESSITPTIDCTN